MMVLSRLWYVIVAIVASLALYAVSLAMGQYNRSLEGAMKEELKGDVQVVGLSLQFDARRRLDGLLFSSASDDVKKALKAATGKEPIPPAAKADGKKALGTINERLPDDVRFDAVFAVDRDGRVVAQIGYDQVNSAPDFELGGYPAVFDALRGHLRDDTWVLAGRLYRVSARPIEDEGGQPALGAVVGLRAVDDRFAQELGKRTRTSLVFFTGDVRAAGVSSDDRLTQNTLDLAVTAGAKLEADAYNDAGRSEFVTLENPQGDNAGGAFFLRMPGEAGVVGAAYAVVRRHDVLTSPTEFVTGADAEDKARAKGWILALIGVGLAAVGVLFTFLEHARPLKELRRQAARFQKGEQDSFQLPRLAADYRAVAADVNHGVERLVETRGGVVAKKPADLQSILGPAPVQPQMSAFSLPGSPSGPASSPGLPSAPGPQAAAPSRPQPPAASAFGPPPPKAPPPAAKSASQATPPPTTPKAPPPAAPKLAPPVPRLVPPSTGRIDDLEPEDDADEATRVGEVPAQVLAAAKTLNEAAAPAARPAAAPAADTQNAEWRAVFDDFVKTKRECGESTEGLTFEKFQNTLTKNRDALLQRPGTKRVRFAVYVKDGKAALKATPLKD